MSQCNCQFPEVTEANDFFSFSLPLLDLVTRDLPSSSKAPELDDRNAIKALEADNSDRIGADTSDSPAGSSYVTEETIGIYLGYLLAMGFMPPPPESSGGDAKRLPDIRYSDGQKESFKLAGGRK